VPIEFHPLIRSEKACYEATKRARELGNNHNDKLHILHLAAEAETQLFRNGISLSEKNITTEVSVHHLWFCDKDYLRLGNLKKWNPAIKTEKDKQGLLKALLDGRIDTITTVRARRTMEEKQKLYFQSMSGAPLVRHWLFCLLEFYKQGLISLEKITEKICPNPAMVYHIEIRGFTGEDYYADLTWVDLKSNCTVSEENFLYKCVRSPLEVTTFTAKVLKTFVNGNMVYDNGIFDERVKGQALVIAKG